MPKSLVTREYVAVRNGKEGTKIYDSWWHAEPHLRGITQVSFKRFLTRLQAETWLSQFGSHARCSHTGTSKSVVTKDGPAGPSDTSLGDTPWFVSLRREQLLMHRCAGIEGGLNHDSDNVILSSAQQDVLNIVKSRKSVFFTGAAGTGKSVLLREIIQYCSTGDENQKEVAVTASTGIASIQIGGQTIHSWAGIGKGEGNARSLLGKILGQHKQDRIKEIEWRIAKGLPVDDSWPGPQDTALRRWKDVQVLIVDEISMIDGRLFDKLEFIARDLRGSSKPFGGIQLVLSGDFCQLPPVRDKTTGEPAPFTFESKTWDVCVNAFMTLHEVFRQEETEFIDALNTIRFSLGTVDPFATRLFRSLSREPEFNDGLSPTKLFPKTSEVDEANMACLKEIKEGPRSYAALDVPGWDNKGDEISQEATENILDRLVARKRVVLKVGAQVMLIKNLVQGHLVNGSLGILTQFCAVHDGLRRGIRLGVADHYWTVKRSPMEILEAYNEQIPYEIIDEDSLLITEHFHDYRISREVADLIKSPRQWPVASFRGTEIICVPSRFDVSNTRGGIQARRVQIPLILAWAFSIHKSQGQTLERVRVDLTNIFERGQAYVALSRTRRLDGLQVLNFDPAKIQTHPRVLRWMLDHDLVPSSMVTSINEDLQYWDSGLL